MTLDEAIKYLENYGSTSIGCLLDNRYREAVERVKQPPSLADLLKMKEGAVYEWRGSKYRIFSGIFQYFDEEEHIWLDSIEELNDYLQIREGKKEVE